MPVCRCYSYVITTLFTCFKSIFSRIEVRNTSLGFGFYLWCEQSRGTKKTKRDVCRSFSKLTRVKTAVMHSLAQEIQGFSKSALKKQCTRVTTVTGRKLLERRSDGGEGQEQVEELEEGDGCGFVEDNSLDLQVGVVRPFLLLASQDAAHDINTLLRYKVSHVLNVAYGVTNLFPDQLVYKTLQILDLPDTDITSYMEECSLFIDQAREKKTDAMEGDTNKVASEVGCNTWLGGVVVNLGEDGVVLVHCNAGVSRSSSIVIGYLMLREKLSFEEAYSQVKAARPSIRPNPGFYQQLQSYTP